MNQTLKDAIRAVEARPDDAQEEIAQALLAMTARKRIEARLGEAEARGGTVPHKEVVTRLRARYGGC